MLKFFKNKQLHCLSIGKMTLDSEAVDNHCVFNPSYKFQYFSFNILESPNIVAAEGYSIKLIQPSKYPINNTYLYLFDV